MDLVPGDVVNLSMSSFNLVPSDLFLLSGDAIVNESMLTGESVPVSKIPVKDEDLVKWKDGGEENSKSFLYGGTKVVRIRGTITADPSASQPCLAVVARTGNYTPSWKFVTLVLKAKQGLIQQRAPWFARCCSQSPLVSSSIKTPSVLLLYWLALHVSALASAQCNSFE
jgi:magnesium-transporting ATPase (P-type)